MEERMKAIILAAGVGSRLRPITDNKPKCLVKVAGKPILWYQIDAFYKAGIKDITIVTGHLSEQIKDFINTNKFQWTGTAINIIENNVYNKTNNMYSLYLTKPFINSEAFLLINGDVAIESAIVKAIVDHDLADLIAVEKGNYNDESMKIIVDTNNRVIDISKKIVKENSFGTSIDLYKFSKTSSEIFFKEMKRIIEDDNNLNDWTEIALQRLLNSNRLHMTPMNIENKKWVEIDNYEDLALADKLFADFDRSLSDKKLLFIDLDGTVYLGDNRIDGSDKFIEYLNNNGIKFYFFSNNSSKSKEEYIQKLKKFKIDTSIDNIILSTDGLIDYLKNNKIFTVYTIGTAAMKKMLRENGIEPESDSPELIVLGYDTELTYEKLKKACIFLNKGLEYIATHIDVVCPTPDGNIPDIGSFMKLIEMTTGKKPLKTFGKPNKEMLEFVLKRENILAKESALIGDRIYTDKKLADNAWCSFICVLSGETQRHDLEELENFPDLISKTLFDII